MKLIRLVLILILLAAAYAVWAVNAPYQGFQGETFVVLPHGTGTRRIAEALRSAGVIRSTWGFLLARAVRSGATLQAGEYRFDTPASPLEVLDRIARGDIYYHELVVPEGRNMFDIAAAIAKLGLMPAAQFLKAARNPKEILDLDPSAPTLEGYLFPNTYRLTRSTTPEQLCHIMTSKFREVWKGLGVDAGVHRTVTLASLVEKEGKLPEERPMIAAVFLRRLDIGMKLDCDPTTIYAALLDGRYNGAIHRSDLDSDNPYNTYRHTGLPPGPIANPGLASIQAVLHPTEGRYLYFVKRPDNSGGHTFSADLASQAEAVQRFRQGR